MKGNKEIKVKSLAIVSHGGNVLFILDYSVVVWYVAIAVLGAIIHCVTFLFLFFWRSSFFFFYSVYLIQVVTFQEVERGSNFTNVSRESTIQFPRDIFQTKS